MLQNSTVFQFVISNVIYYEVPCKHRATIEVPRTEVQVKTVVRIG